MAARQPLTSTSAADAGSANANNNAPTIAKTATMETRTLDDRISRFAPRLVHADEWVPPEPEALCTPSSQPGVLAGRPRLVYGFLEKKRKIFEIIVKLLRNGVVTGQRRYGACRWYG
jgi:hypothetical protein